MRLASVEVVPYALPFREPYVTARGTLTEREIVLLRIRDDDGVEGLGEAVPLSLRGGAALEAVVAELETWAQDPDTEPRSGPARSAVESALLDLRSRVAGTPAWKELGGERAEPVRCNATLTAGEPSAVATQASDWAGAGFVSFKLKVGVPGDEEQVGAARAALGSDALIRIDANGAWGPDEAVVKLARMSVHDVEFAEEPVHGLDDLANLRRRCDVRIAADESVSGPREAAEAAERGACDMTTVKLSKVGGIAPLLEIASLIQTYLSSALDGPVGIAAAAHAAQALRERGGDAGVAHGLATQRLFSETIASIECDLRTGMLHLPEGPGLGIVIDENALDRHRL